MVKNMEQVDISVVVPTYNRSDLIGETLDSILGQSYPPIEIIVVDDGSSDDTEDVLQSYSSDVTYLRIENSGECRARNVGVAATSGNWIAFCDSDDLWRVDKLALQVSLVHENPNLAYSFTNFKHVVDGHWSETTKFDGLPAEFWNLSVRKSCVDAFVVLEPMFDRLLKNQPIFPSTLMMKRSFFASSGGWNEALGRTPSVDFEYHLRCAVQCMTGVVAAPVVGIRKHSANFSGDPLKTAIGEIEILRYVFEHHEEVEQYRDTICEQIVVRSERAVHAAFENKRFDLAYKLLENVPFERQSLKLRVKTMMCSL